MDHQRLNALLALAEAPRCRRMTLLAYFGETLEAPCGACDLCREPPKLFDGTVAAQKALSAMLRTGERFGVEHLIAVLRGEATEAVTARGHNKLPTFGAGREFDRGQWRGVFRQLSALGLTLPDPHGGWRMAEAALGVLRGQQRLELREDAVRAERRGGRPAPAALVAEQDEALLSALKAKRRELAEAQGVPAYVVFPDRTLIEMATAKPATLDAMAAISGVGAKKLEQYGRTFLQVLTGGPIEAPHPARMKLDRGERALYDALEGAARDLARGADGTGKPLGVTSATLARVAEARPRSVAALARVPGMDDARAERFGPAFLAAIDAAQDG
jgi:ATP-dependent DNA helicase RecQ